MTIEGLNQFQAPLNVADAAGTNPAGTLAAALKGQNIDNCASASISISGTFVGTISFEASGDGGATWYLINAATPTSATGVSTATAPGLFQLNVAAFTNLRARMSAYTSGAALVTINLSTAGFGLVG